MERDVVLPLKPKLYRQFVDDTYRRRKKNEPDELFSKMNSYHPNINITIEINWSKFLDTKIVRNKNEIKWFRHHKDNKLPFHWKSALPRNYEKNVIVGDHVMIFIKPKKIFSFHHHYLGSRKKLTFRYHIVKEIKRKWNELFAN